MTRVLLVDDHASYREAIAFILERDPNFEVTAQAGSLAEARAVSLVVDIAIVDLTLPDGNGVSIISDLLKRNPNGIVVVLTGSADQRDYARAVEAGATGILSKAKPLSEILEALQRVSTGGLLL